jgi:hypothetical protein
VTRLHHIFTTSPLAHRSVLGTLSGERNEVDVVGTLIGTMRRARTATAGAALVAAVPALFLAACTDDSGYATVVIDDGGTAAATLAAAVESTVGDSGRIEMTANGTFGHGGTAWSQVATVQFIGDDSLTTTTITFDDAGEPVESTIESLSVDGATYFGTPTYGATAGGNVVEAPYPDGIEWIDASAMLPQSSADPGASAAAVWRSFSTAFLGLSEVTEVDAQRIDGESFRSFDARLGTDQLAALMGATGEAPPGVRDPAEWEERFASVQRYAGDHVWVDATVLIDGDGRLRRVTLEWFDDVDAAFEGCIALTGFVSTERAQLDFFDVGGDVGPIEAPDPETVMSVAEQQALLMDATPSGPTPTTVVSSDDLSPGPSSTSGSVTESSTVVDQDRAQAADGSGDVLAHLSTGEEFMFEGCPE